MSNELSIIKPADNYRLASDVAGLCKQIVINSAVEIQGRKYVKAEGWLAIATAHGCVASARDVEQVEGGIRCIGEVRKISDGIVIATAEGFVGDDEPMWQKRPMYARRAMAQTRAISRVCRSAFAHVVVLMDAGLSTTPAEEVPNEGFDNRQAGSDDESRGEAHPVEPVPGAYWKIEQSERHSWLESKYGKGAFVKKVEKDWRVFAYAAQAPATTEQPAQQSDSTGNVGAGIGVAWQDVTVHFGKTGGKIKGKRLADLDAETIDWLADYLSKKEPGKLSKADRGLQAAVAMAIGERKPAAGKEQAQPNEGDEIPMFNGEHHKTLAENLEWAGISVGDFILCAKRNRWIPQDASGFEMMSDETAKKFTEDFATVQSGVEAWREAQKGGDQK